MDGQADVLKRLPSGIYILEELKAPEGYVKGLPSGISVAEMGELQHVQMVDRTTKIEISKIHAPQGYQKCRFWIWTMNIRKRERNRMSAK